MDSLLRSKGTVKFPAKPEKNRGKGSSSKVVKESRCWRRQVCRETRTTDITRVMMPKITNAWVHLISSEWILKGFLF